MQKGSMLYLSEETTGMEFVKSEDSKRSYPLHSHVSTFIVGWLLRGSVCMARDRSTVRLRAGQTFVIEPYLPHSIEAAETYTMVCVCIGKDVAKTLRPAALSAAIRLLSRAAFADDESGSVCASKLIEAAQALALPQDMVRRAALDAVRLQLELFPEKHLKVEEMSQLAFVSTYHFIRCFKKEIGLTPHQFQLQNRIRQARVLLRQGFPMTEVALRAGFCDQSHFIRRFEKIVGLSPVAYRNACRCVRLQQVMPAAQK